MIDVGTANAFHSSSYNFLLQLNQSKYENDFKRKLWGIIHGTSFLTLYVSVFYSRRMQWGQIDLCPAAGAVKTKKNF